jgi:hypothetical protein
MSSASNTKSFQGNTGSGADEARFRLRLELVDMECVLVASRSSKGSCKSDACN